MKKFVKKIKTCVNCRHLEILEEGQVVSGLEDTAYIAFKCNIFNYAGKEVFQFPKVDKKIVIEKQSEDCPFWEEWVRKPGKSEVDTGSSEEDALEPDEY